MQEFSTGAGFAALGFWLFIATIIAVGMWESIKKRESQHETLRRIIESGQPIDAELTDKLLALTGGNKALDRDLKVGGLIMLFIAPGMVLLGWGLSILEEELLIVMTGIGGLIGLIGVGLLVAAYVVRRWHGDDPA